MSDTPKSDLEYYQSYYDRMGDKAYLGEGAKHTSRMLVFQDWLRSYLKPGARVLDIGCGDAIFAELMPEFEWYGVDINVERAKARIPGTSGHTLRLVEQDLMKPPYGLWDSGYFDAVISSECLEHLWDLRIVHKEAKRLLKRDGVYVISTPNADWLTNHLESFRRILSDFNAHWTIEHIRHYIFDSHQKWLNEVGFVVDRHTGADGHYCPVTASICRKIRDGLRDKGVDIEETLLHKWAGEGIPFYSHTTVISARKA